MTSEGVDLQHQHKPDLNGFQSFTTSLLHNIQDPNRIGRIQRLVVAAKASKLVAFLTRNALVILTFGILTYAGLSIASYLYFNASVFYSALFKTSEDVNQLLLMVPIIISCIGLYATMFHPSSSRCLRIVSVNLYELVRCIHMNYKTD